jgi:hypothetical protein
MKSKEQGIWISLLFVMQKPTCSSFKYNDNMEKNVKIHHRAAQGTV